MSVIKIVVYVLAVVLSLLFFGRFFFELKDGLSGHRRDISQRSIVIVQRAAFHSRFFILWFSL